jgi:hypothetical protein
VVTLPNEHHYVRYCKPTQVQEGEVLSQAFMLREQDIDGLSGDHFEHYNNYQQILKSLTERFSPSKNGCFVKLNCGEVINNTKKFCKISFIKDDEEKSHTAMTGLILGDDVIPLVLVTLIKEIISIHSL